MSDDRIRVTYRLRVPATKATRCAEALALEQSVEMPRAAVTDPRVLAEIVGQVEDVREEDDGSSIARIALAVETVGEEPGQLMNMLFGNCSLLPYVELVDLELPAGLCRQFAGPNHGIAGLRALCAATVRPLTCTALKPIGSTVEQLAGLCSTFAAAGLDVIKDDHGWANQASAPFRQRVAACQRAIEQAGTRTLYAPSLYGSESQMREQIDHAYGLGVRIFLIAPMVSGVATLVALKRAYPEVAFLGHPALAGNTRIAPAVLLGKLFRLFGADAVIFPNHGGRFTYPPATCEAIARTARVDCHGLKPMLPVPAGGMSVERVPELVQEYGHDVMLLIGGSLLIAGDALATRSRSFVDAVATAGGQP